MSAEEPKLNPAEVFALRASEALTSFLIYARAFPNSRVRKVILLPADDPRSDTAYWHTKDQHIGVSAKLLGGIINEPLALEAVIGHETGHSSFTLSWPGPTLLKTGFHNFIVQHLEDWRLNTFLVEQFPHLNDGFSALYAAVRGQRKEQAATGPEKAWKCIYRLWNGVSDRSYHTNFPLQVDYVIRSSDASKADLWEKLRPHMLGYQRQQPDFYDPVGNKERHTLAIGHAAEILRILEEEKALPPDRSPSAMLKAAKEEKKRREQEKSDKGDKSESGAPESSPNKDKSKEGTPQEGGSKPDEADKEAKSNESPADDKPQDKPDSAQPKSKESGTPEEEQASQGDDASAEPTEEGEGEPARGSQGNNSDNEDTKPQDSGSSSQGEQAETSEGDADEGSPKGGPTNGNPTETGSEGEASEASEGDPSKDEQAQEGTEPADGSKPAPNGASESPEPQSESPSEGGQSSETPKGAGTADGEMEWEEVEDLEGGNSDSNSDKPAPDSPSPASEAEGTPDTGTTPPAGSPPPSAPTSAGATPGGTPSAGSPASEPTPPSDGTPSSAPSGAPSESGATNEDLEPSEEFKEYTDEELDEAIEALEHIERWTQAGKPADAKELTEDEMKEARQKALEDAANHSDAEKPVEPFKLTPPESPPNTGGDTPLESLFGGYIEPGDLAAYNEFVKEWGPTVAQMRKLFANAQSKRDMEQGHKANPASAGPRIRMRAVARRLASRSSDERKLFYTRESSYHKGRQRMKFDDVLLALDSSGSMSSLMGTVHVYTAAIYLALQKEKMRCVVATTKANKPWLVNDGNIMENPARVVATIGNIQGSGDVDLANGSIQLLRKKQKPNSDPATSRIVILSDCCATPRDINAVKETALAIGYPLCIIVFNHAGLESHFLHVKSEIPFATFIVSKTEASKDGVIKTLTALAGWMSDPEAVYRRSNGVVRT